MNREIKFRGIKTLTKQVIYGSPICDDKGQVVAICQQRVNPICLGEISGWVFSVKNAGQYTGLKDKNGKEIYEGDIVKWGHVKGGEENPIRIAQVVINPDIQFEIIVNKGYFLKKTFPFGQFMYSDTHNWVEVIGNVFENPELLQP